MQRGMTKSTIDELVIDLEVTHLVATTICVDLLEDGLVVQIQPTIAALVNNPRNYCRTCSPVLHLDTLATRVSAPRTSRSTEGGPSILLAPRQRFVGIPCGTICAHFVQVPVVLLWVVIMIRGSHVGCFLCSSHGRGSAEERHHHECSRSGDPRHHFENLSFFYCAPDGE